MKITAHCQYCGSGIEISLYEPEGFSFTGRWWWFRRKRLLRETLKMWEEGHRCVTYPPSRPTNASVDLRPSSRGGHPLGPPPVGPL
jgi:hypothetical protein